METTKNNYQVSEETAKFINCHKMLQQVYEAFYDSIAWKYKGDDYNELMDNFYEHYKSLDKIILDEMTKNIVENTANLDFTEI